jgi:predicted NACHT family NTPase
MKGYNFPVAKVITAIASVAATPIKNKLERNETVIKLLEKVGLDPEHPPADFSGVYAYTLVKYGVGKPRQILELFRQKDIKRAFRETFEQDDFLILIKKGQEFIDGYALGDEIKELSIDLLPEFAAFGMVFIDVANSTRTPSEVLRDRKIDTVMRSVADIQEQISRLKNPNEILLELARQSRSYQELQPARESKNKKIGTFILAQQMKGWFETLGYKFDSYSVEEDNYFEWIINIPARRGYERILVRAVEGEGKLSDIRALQRIVNEQKTIEGWLVASRRISPAVRDKVKKEGNQGIFCYTFDELLDQQADFSKYLDWLEAEVKRKGIDRMYVPLACTKEEFDPITQEKLGVSCYDEDEGWIDGYIDNWLNDRTKEHISILGEFGTGKTWLTLHYAWAALQRYRDAKKRGVERPRIPLVIPLRDYATAVTVESLFSEFFFRKYEIPLAGYSVFEQLNRMGKLLLIFDGFDEMADRVDSQKMINNFWELAQVVVPGSKAILTCRSEHFPEAKAGRALLNAELEASISALTGEPPQFEVLELKKFNDDQIRQVLSFRAGASTVKEIMGNYQLLDLARRPVMTELILEALPDIEAGKPVDMSRVYLYAVRTKMERDIKAERTFTSLADKLYFLCELSWEMLSTNQMSLNYRLFPDRLRRLFSHAVQEQKHLDHWHFDMMGQTMLIRNADGDYTPAHRSLLEFFVAYKFAAEIGILAPDFMEVAKAQSHLNELLSSNYTWSSYFSRKCDGKGDIEPVPSLEEFIPETVTLLAETIGKEPLIVNEFIANEMERERDGAILKLLLKMISPDKNKVNTRLLSLIRETKGKSSEEVGILGGNIASILIRYDSQALRGQNIAGTNLTRADLSNADLTECNLEYADLNKATFIDTKLVNASLQGVNLREACITNVPWIRSIGLGNNSKVVFYYSLLDDPYKSPKLPFGVQDNEVVVALIEDEQFKWIQKIESTFLLKYDSDEDVIRLLTIEGRHLVIEIKTGRYLLNEETSSLRNWDGADLADAIGLNKKDIHLLRAWGALNLPNTSYNPYNNIRIPPALLDEAGQSEPESKNDLHP